MISKEERELGLSLSRLIERVEGLSVLDKVERALKPVANRLTANDTVKRVLSGTPVRHRLHPMLTDVPLGCYMSASLIDTFAWRSGAASARRLTAMGLVATMPTVASGLSDWNDTHGATRRVGSAHAVANTVGTLFELASWRARRKGHHVRGAVLGFGGLGVFTFAGYLGGHLVYADRVGVDHEVDTVEDRRWHQVCSSDALIEGEAVGATIDGARVALVRWHERVYALAAVCTHAGGPLDEGKVSNGALECPWHGSVFRLRDGEVERGPATTPEPVYEVRIRGGYVEVRATEQTRLHAAV